MATADWVKRLAVPIADKIVYASGAYVSLKTTVNGLGDRLIDFQSPVSGLADERLRKVALLIRPMTGTGLRLVRVGGDHDGGYVMADEFSAGGAISVGVGPDVSWDQAVASRGIPVAMFDPTVRRLPAPVVDGRFFKVGIGPDRRAPGYLPLPDLVRMAGFADDVDLLLKVDVEGAEWASLENLDTSHLVRYRQMAFEFHGLKQLNDEGVAGQITSVLAKLAAHHAPIHVHSNNYDELARFDDNWFPNSIEVTYLRRDLLVDPAPAEVIRNVLDRPCDPRVAEIGLEALRSVVPTQA